MSHQTNNVFDTVAENATNDNDKFDNIDCQVNIAQISNVFTFASSGFKDPGGREIVYVSSSNSSWDEKQEMAIHCGCVKLHLHSGTITRNIFMNTNHLILR